MTLQEIFNKVVERSKTKIVACSPRGYCVYRTPSGLACFAGCLIPDIFYSPELEGHIVLTNDDVRFLTKISVVNEALYKAGIDNNQKLNLVCQLQRIHDSFDPHEWEGKLKEIANEHGLSFPEA